MLGVCLDSFLRVDGQFFQHYLFKWLSLLHCVALAFLSHSVYFMLFAVVPQVLDILFFFFSVFISVTFSVLQVSSEIS